MVELAVLGITCPKTAGMPRRYDGGLPVRATSLVQGQAEVAASGRDMRNQYPSGNQGSRQWWKIAEKSKCNKNCFVALAPFAPLDGG